MNPDVIQVPWQQLKIQLRKTSSKLTDEDLEAVSHDGNELVRVVLQRSGSDSETATTPSRLSDRDVPADRGRSASTRLRIGTGT